VDVDAITLLKQDHKTVKALFRKFEGLGDRAHAAKRKVADEIVKELSIHASIEELVFYPAVKGLSEKLAEHVNESLEEHHVVKWLCSEIEKMDPDHERFDAKVTVLIENVRHHVEEEEGEFFPEVRDALGRKTLGELGELMEKAKRMAPTRPHPRSPDEPPANAIASAVSGLIDRARTAGAEALTAARRRTTRPTSRRPAAAKPARKAATATRTATRTVTQKARSTAKSR
jgi:hemerythrin superfamily protein